MQHRDFGDEVALEAQSWMLIKPGNTPGNPRARPSELNPTYGYVWDNKGVWRYASTIHQDLYVPLPDGSRAKIKHLVVDDHEKMLGVFS